MSLTNEHVLWISGKPQVTHTRKDVPMGAVEIPGAGELRVVPPPRAEEGRNRIVLRFNLPFAASAGQWIEVACRVRAVDAAPETAGQAGVVLNLSTSPADGDARSFYRHILLAGSEWESFRLPIKLPADMEAGVWEMVLEPSFFEQGLEISGLQIRTSSAATQLESRPMYEGQESDAPWRMRANEMIEKHRKADLKVTVLDEAGRPLKGARVTVRQTRHGYLFGSAVAAARMVDAPRVFAPDSGKIRQRWLEDNERYRQEFLRLFNCGVIENALKWPQWSGDVPSGHHEQAWTLQALTWLASHDIVIKGHTMMWPSWRMTPSWLRKLDQKPEALQAAILRHIRDVGAATAQFTAYWDVMNEPMSHRDILELLGPAQAAEWFHAARSVLPQTRLVVNEFDIVGNGGSPKRRAQLYALLKALRSFGAPVDAIGFQAHFWSERLTPPERVWDILDEVHNATGLPAMVSEFDMNFPNEALQADFTRDFLTAWFAHPQTEAFIFWGFWAGAHWMGEAGAMIREDWTPKPNLKAYTDLVFGEWWTRCDGATNLVGVYHVRAFAGNHRLVITAPGRIQAVREVALSMEGASIHVVLGKVEH